MIARDGSDTTTIQRGLFTAMGSHIANLPDGYISVIRPIPKLTTCQILMTEVWNLENLEILHVATQNKRRTKSRHWS